MGATGVLWIGLVLSIVGALVTAWWSRWVWMRRRALAVRMRAIAVFVATSAMLGALGIVVGLVKLLGALGGESVDPSQAVRIMAEGISGAINDIAFGLIVWAPSVLGLVFATSKLGQRSE